MSEISDAGFTLTDQKTATATKFAYKDVKSRKKGISKGWMKALVMVDWSGYRGGNRGRNDYRR